jgi:cell division protein FtsA
MIRNVKVGIDIGTHATRVVVAEFEKGNPMPKILGTGQATSRGVRHGYIINGPEATKSIRKAIEEAEKNAGIPIRRIYLSIGGISLGSETATGTTVMTRADGEVTALDVDNAMKESEEGLKLTNKKVIHAVPIAYKIDSKEIMGGPLGMRGSKLEVKTLFVTSLEKHLDDLLASVRDAGVEIIDVIASPIAASYMTLGDRQKTVGCALVNIGAETVSIAAFENGTIISLQVFSIGSTDITNDIALGLKIPLEEAEGIKTGSMAGDHSKRKLDEIIEARLRDIFELVDNHLKKIKRSGLLPAGIVITGGGANLTMIESLAKTTLKLPAKIGSAVLFENTKSKVRDHAWFVAAGLTLAGAAGGAEISSSGSFGALFKKAKSVLSGMFKQLMP